MTGKKILVGYSSLYGYVEEISLEISKILEQKGFLVHPINLKKVRSSKWPYIGEYTGILVGSSSEMARYALSRYGPGKIVRRDPKNFLRTNLNEISQTNKILGIFRSDPLDFSVILNPDPAANLLEELIIKKFGYKPSICAWFGPVIDFKSKKFRYDIKKYMRRELKKISRKTGLEFNLRGHNDFRDWERINEFTMRFAEMVDPSLKSSGGSDTCPGCGTKINPSWKFCADCNYKLK